MAHTKDGEKLNDQTANAAEAANVVSGDGSADVLDVSEKWLEDIKYWLQVFAEEYGIEDISKSTQNQFNSLLKFAGKEVFVKPRTLKSKRLYDIKPLVGVHGNTAYKSNNNAYDVDLVTKALELYISLCGMYDKAVSPWGFSWFSGVDEITLKRWESGEVKNLSNSGRELYKTVLKARERSLTDILTTGKRQQVGILGVLNHESGWNMPGVSREKTVKVALSAADLPSLGASSGASAGSVGQIAQRMESQVGKAVAIERAGIDDENEEKRLDKGENAIC